MPAEPHSSQFFANDPPAFDATPEISGFTTERLLGRGGSGEAWLVRQSRPFERVLVAKVFRPIPDASSMLARFERERAAISALTASGARDPGLAAIHDAGLTRDGRPFVLMQFVDGVPATEAVTGRPESEVLEILRQCCLALAPAHERGLVHQDITPSNVIVSLRSDGSPHATLIDFGLAASAGTRTNLLGTPDWMAPEQRDAGGGAVTPATDVWALGRLLRALLERSERRDGPLRAELGRIAADCMAARPGERPADARMLLARLDGAAPRASSAARRRMRTSAVAALALALGTVAAARMLLAPRWSAVPADAVALLDAGFATASSATLPGGWDPRNAQIGSWALATEIGGGRRVLAGHGTDGAHAQVVARLSQSLRSDDAWWLEWTMRVHAPANPAGDESDFRIYLGPEPWMLTLAPQRGRLTVMRNSTPQTPAGVERAEDPTLGFRDHAAWVRYRIAREPGRATVLVVERSFVSGGETAVSRIELNAPPDDPVGEVSEILLAVQERQPLEIGEIRLWTPQRKR